MMSAPNQADNKIQRFGDILIAWLSVACERYSKMYKRIEAEVNKINAYFAEVGFTERLEASLLRTGDILIFNAREPDDPPAREYKLCIEIRIPNRESPSYSVADLTCAHRKYETVAEEGLDEYIGNILKAYYGSRVAHAATEKRIEEGRPSPEPI